MVVYLSSLCIITEIKKVKRSKYLFSLAYISLHKRWEVTKTCFDTRLGEVSKNVTDLLLLYCFILI